MNNEFKFRIDLHVHNAEDDERLERIEEHLKQLKQQGDTLMTMTADQAKRLDAATNAIAARLQTLVDAVAAGDPLTPEQQAQVEADIAALEKMGKDPANPV